MTQVLAISCHGDLSDLVEKKKHTHSDTGICKQSATDAIFVVLVLSVLGLFLQGSNTGSPNAVLANRKKIYVFTLY